MYSFFLVEFNPAYIAAEIEEATFEMFNETNSKYKNRIKSRVMNLRDKRNVALKTMIVQGEISPQRFAKMTADVSENYLILYNYQRYTLHSSKSFTKLSNSNVNKRTLKSFISNVNIG